MGTHELVEGGDDKLQVDPVHLPRSHRGCQRYQQHQQFGIGIGIGIGIGSWQRHCFPLGSGSLSVSVSGSCWQRHWKQHFPSPPAATDTVTVTQTYTFPSLTVATYIGDMKSNCECAYANTVEGVTPATWCTGATNTYKTGIVMASSAAARRAAKVTFVLNVKTSIKSKSQLTTLVASHSTATKFAAALAAVNTATNKTVDPGTATAVSTATFTGGSSSASALLPSMLSLVAAIFVAARQ